MRHGYLKREEWTLVGHMGVDAGLCWIGDPCYIFPSAFGEEKDMPESLGKNWGDFCNTLGENYPTMKSYNYAVGHEGLGCVVSTGFGDGTYPVYARVSDEGEWGKRVTAVFVDFMGNAFGDEDEDDELDEEELEEAAEIREVQGYAEADGE